MSLCIGVMETSWFDSQREVIEIGSCKKECLQTGIVESHRSFAPAAIFDGTFCHFCVYSATLEGASMPIEEEQRNGPKDGR